MNVDRRIVVKSRHPSRAMNLNVVLVMHFAVLLLPSLSCLGLLTSSSAAFAAVQDSAKSPSTDLEPPAAAQSGPPVTPAQEAAEIKASGRFLPPLIPEGGMLLRANATLQRDDFLGAWTIVLQDRVNGASNRSLILLPAGPMGDMIARHRRAVRDGSSAPLFEVSGKVLAFGRTNFFLPSFAAPVTRVIEPSQPDALEAPGSRNAIGSVGRAPTAPKGASPMGASTASADPAPPIDPEVFAQQLEQKLMAQTPAVPANIDPDPAAAQVAAGVEQPSRATDPNELPMPEIPMPAASQSTTGAEAAPTASADSERPFVLPIPRDPPIAPAQQQGGAQSVALPSIGPAENLPSRIAPLLPPMRIHSRRGVVTRDAVTGTWRFVLASGSRDDGDHSIEILPCEQLKSLITMARSSQMPVHVLLTGDVTVSDGRNYILPIRSKPIYGGRWIGP
ncbi:MAG: hypothetical protein ACKO4V_00650 [Planctomycetota bacterium]